MKNMILIVVFLLVSQVSLMAQGAATFHVFPQIADGSVGDGTAYITSVLATNVNTLPATCTLRFYGVSIGRLSSASPATITIPSQGSFAQWSTTGNGNLLTGYASLTCDRPVTAGASYLEILTSNSVVIAGATVFSSPPTMRANIIVAEQPNVHTAFALANDTDVAGQYQVTVTDASTGQTRSATITVPARSNFPKYVNQIVQLPQQFSGTAVITSTSGPFSLVGLAYIWSIFVSLPATTY